MRMFLVLLFSTSLAYGQVQRTFVSAHTGSDANPCGPTTPCRSFGAAMALTLPGGEIIVLDSGGYGVVTISQSVSLISPAGVYAGISAFSGYAVDINTAGLTVVLDGLTLNGLGGLTGIYSNVQGTLYVKRCVITGFSNAIYLNGPTQFFASDMEIRNNRTGGLYAGPAGHYALDHVLIANSSTAVHTETNVVFNADHCVLVANSVYGLDAYSGDDTLESCLIAGNGTGVGATYGTVRISNCTITDNTTKGLLGPTNPAGRIYSRLNNTIEGNAADDTPTMYTAK